jgi:hypothetical protein
VGGRDAVVDVPPDRGVRRYGTGALAVDRDRDARDELRVDD